MTIFRFRCRGCRRTIAIVSDERPKRPRCSGCCAPMVIADPLDQERQADAERLLVEMLSALAGVD